jgi:coenzyme F420 hydrogenase subunit beta
MPIRAGFKHAGSVAEVELCHGCGVCAYICDNGAISLSDRVDEGLRPVIDRDKCSLCGRCLKICTGITLNRERCGREDVVNELSRDWGTVLEIWEGSAADAEICRQGSSGGVVTALSLFCLEEYGLQGVLHCGMDPERPWQNRINFDSSREELLKSIGSRYSPAAPGAELKLIEEAANPSVFIGKPCDVAAARRAAKIKPQLSINLGLTISLFCAGTPATRATCGLIDELGTVPDEINKLYYRGPGWPGKTGVELKGGNPGECLEMNYVKAWNLILRGTIPFRCRICPDGTGEFADIACGDPWYRRPADGEAGSSLIIVRTPRGREILRQAMEQGVISAKLMPLSVLPRSQSFLYRRRQQIMAKKLAFKLVRLPAWEFKGFSLQPAWLELPLLRRIKTLIRALPTVWKIKKKRGQATLL